MPRRPRVQPVPTRAYRTVPAPKGPGTRSGTQYEHRVVAEQALGRPMEPREQVRFHGEPPARPVRPEDFRVVVTESDGPRYRPGVDDYEETVDCACGCGAPRYRWDHGGRERRYLPGHQYAHLPAPAQTEILAALERGGAMGVGDIARATTRSADVVSELLRRMGRRGIVARDGRVWGIAESRDNGGERETARPRHETTNGDQP